jgi:hypothetical protein
MYECSQISNSKDEAELGHQCTLYRRCLTLYSPTSWRYQTPVLNHKLEVYDHLYSTTSLSYLTLALTHKLEVSDSCTHPQAGGI